MPKPKLYLDQMFSLDVAKILRKRGYDVLRASETGLSRADDQQILQKAISENRVLITLDEHFGDWTILPLSKHSGVIRLKVHPTTSEKMISILLPLLNQRKAEEFKNHLVIASEKRTKWILTIYEE
jgi:predicted nuclease of predicted toxin-antitoxin system